jgi:hypothetical protein
MQLLLKKQLNELKRKRLKQAKFGFYVDWDSFDISGLMFTVPVYSKKDDELLFFETYMTQDSLPKDKQYLWQDNEINNNESISKDESRQLVVDKYEG